MDFDAGGADGLLLLGDSERNADLFYATRFRAPDPFAFLWTPEQSTLLISPLELDRARAQARVDRVFSTTPYRARLQERGEQNPTADAALLEFLRERGARRLKVPADFPLGTAEFLRRGALELQVLAPPLFAARQIKDGGEIEAIRQSMAATEAAMEAAVEILRRAEVRQGVLHLDGEALTSGRVRQCIHRTLLERECSARHTIVAGGEQGCDPHQQGFGPLRAGEPIIIDIFPCSDVSGYYGDLTRTVVRGRASPALKKLYETVLAGQELALGQIRQGADGSQIHREVLDFFAAAGYQTGERDGYMQGFFHGTGHGLGLEIHEAPRIGAQGDVLRAGQVVTVEPGLYYRGLGGVRIEDVVVVGEGGCQNLASAPKFLEV